MKAKTKMVLNWIADKEGIELGVASYHDNRGYRQRSMLFDLNGRSNDWHIGLFDRWDRDLEELLEKVHK